MFYFITGEKTKMITDQEIESIVGQVGDAYASNHSGIHNYEFWEKEQWDSINDAKKSAFTRLKSILVAYEEEIKRLRGE